MNQIFQSLETVAASYSNHWKSRTIVLGIAAGVCALLAGNASGEIPAIIPRPNQYAELGGALDVSRFSVSGGSTASVAAVSRVLNSAGATDTNDGIAIKLVPLKATESPRSWEMYSLQCGGNAITMAAYRDAGFFYAAQTLRQLIRRDGAKLIVPACKISDTPAFSWRGFMHDVGRNPQDVELLKKFLDVMAQYKMNVFHFHLTDNPGWRIECKAHPELNDPKFQTPTRRPGFFYSYAQINDIIAFCRERGIMVVPELDMPGHSAYFKTAFGCDMQDPRGMKILEDAVNEFMDNVPTEYLHLGSDEVHLRNPKFLDQMADLVRKRGRKILVWRPGGLPKGDVITQLWAAGGKNDTPIKGLPCVDSRHNYINHMDPFDGPCRLLNLAICGQPRGNEHALGGILCHWPDSNVSDQKNVYRQSPVFPSLLAAAESYWCGGAANRPELFGKLPAPDADAFAKYSDFERRMIAHRDAYFRDWPFQYVKQTDIAWKLIGPFDHAGNTATQFPVEMEIRDSYEIGGKTWRWTEARGATIHINHFWYDGWLPKAKTGTAYALTYLHSPSNHTVAFWIGFNGPSRSGRREANPRQGEWSNSGAKIWVNESEIPPPEWKHPGLGSKGAEIPFDDENYFYRAPTPVKLNQGWNKILVKIPKSSAAWKWMFTCVPVRVEGNLVREVPDLNFATTPGSTGK